jgi:predicted TPR repeat methyltransferase
MSRKDRFEHINEDKEVMDDIYDQPDPRAYFRELNKLNYTIPDTAKPIFQKLMNHIRNRRDDTIHLLDLGCSYGVNSAILKHDLSMNALYEHWGHESMVEATSQEIGAYDQQFYERIDDPEDMKMIGLDMAENAISFAMKSGLLDAGIVANLETDMLSAQAIETLAPVDMVMSTGCVGYLTEKSFDRFLPAVSEGQKPWIANFVLRMFPFDAIEKSMDKCGYVTEKLEGQTFFQRQFASDHEQDQVLKRLHDRGIDASGKEAEGHFVAEFYLSRPIDEAKEIPIELLF